jgi:hypothetical protein
MYRFENRRKELMVEVREEVREVAVAMTMYHRPTIQISGYDPNLVPHF